MSKLFEDTVSYRPFYYPWAGEMWKRHESAHWIEDEIPMGDDVSAWKNDRLTAHEKEFVTQILRMFTQADAEVGGLYYKELIPAFKNAEIIKMFGGFANREGIHQNAYALLNDTLGLPEGDYAAFLEYKEMSEKAEFMTDMDPSTKTGLGLSLAKAVFNEGVSLFASFVMLLNFQRRGLMTGMCKVVEWSIRDENMHVEGVAKVFSTLCKEHPRIVNEKFKRDIYDMARKVVELEDAFIDLAYGAGFITGLPKEDVKLYIRYIADRRLIQLGLKENFDVAENPLPWLDWIVSGVNHTNFFENKVSDYSVGGMQGDIHYDADRRFIVYYRDGCPYCDKAKIELINRGYVFEEIDLTDHALRQKFYDDNKFVERTVPKIYEITETGNEFIGGYTELMKHLD